MDLGWAGAGGVFEGTRQEEVEELGVGGGLNELEKEFLPGCPRSVSITTASLNFQSYLLPGVFCGSLLICIALGGLAIRFPNNISLQFMWVCASHFTRQCYTSQKQFRF